MPGSYSGALAGDYEPEVAARSAVQHVTDAWNALDVAGLTGNQAELSAKMRDVRLQGQCVTTVESPGMFY